MLTLAQSPHGKKHRKPGWQMVPLMMYQSACGIDEGVVGVGQGEA
jgi:hypothetical protein